MKKAISISILMLASTAPAHAEALKFKPVIDTRLRFEHVEQSPLLDADALTARVRAGVEASTKDVSFLVEGVGTLAISENYNSLLNGKGAYSPVADPQNINLNRAQIQYRGIPKTVITLGRQRINLDDQRFVGSVGWRDNEQTFDAVRIEWSSIKNVKADLTYAISDRTIWGINGFGTRPQSIDGNNIFANFSYKYKYGLLTGFVYLVDQDDLILKQNSSITYGMRFAGAYPLSKIAKLTYAASYARQNDATNNTNRYAANYILGELGVEAKGFKLLGGYELLGSDKGSSFQTPFATLHKFNGWADKFLTTPANGLQDIYVTAGYTKPKIIGLDSLGFTATYHDYRSDIGNTHYGDEIDAQIAAKMKRYTFTLKYADYRAKGFATNTKKFWASVEWAF